MFTEAGRRTYLKPFTRDAAAVVAAFAQRLLSLYAPRGVVLALHNNGPGYSAASYLPGGEFASAAQAVAIGTLFPPRNFFYVVPGNITTRAFTCLAKANLNAVLQVATAPPDDGSLSVYAGAKGLDYINTEGAAEGGGEGQAVVNQLLNLQALVSVLRN